MMDSNRALVSSGGPTNWNFIIVAFLLGIALGIGGTFWAFNSPVEENGIDYDQDGILDEQWYYVDDRPKKMKADQNLDGDGRMDIRRTFDLYGEIIQEQRI